MDAPGRPCKGVNAVAQIQRNCTTGQGNTPVIVCWARCNKGFVLGCQITVLERLGELSPWRMRSGREREIITHAPASGCKWDKSKSDSVTFRIGHVGCLL